MSDMVERVAKAIAATQAGKQVPWRYCIPDARAAIAAMREPTEAMVDAGAAGAFDHIFEPQEDWDDESLPPIGFPENNRTHIDTPQYLEGTRVGFSAMIDTALKDNA